MGINSTGNGSTSNFTSNHSNSISNTTNTTNTTDCEIIYRLKYACLCPSDYYGDKCDNWNPIVCDIE